MKINSTMVSILLTVIIFSVNGIAQKKRTQSTKSALKTEADNCSFSEREIDLTIDQLPINYLGNNPQAITNEIIKKGKFVKGEFETTIQFQERIAIEKKKKIVGELSYESLLAFSDSDYLPFKYDADKQLMEISPILSSNLFLRTSCQPTISTTVNSFVYDKGEIATYYSLNQKLPLDIENAKLLKPNLRTLYIGQLNHLIGEFYILPSIWRNSITNHRKSVVEFTAKRDNAKIVLNSAKRLLSRLEELLNAGVISKTNYNQIEEILKDAEVNFQNAEAKLKTVKTQLVPYIDAITEISKEEKPAINFLLKEIWIYDISTGKILLKHRIAEN